MRPAVRSLVLFVAGIGIPIAVVVLLAASDFFVGWEGHAVSKRPIPPDSETATVLILEEDGGSFERRWPTSITAGLDLPVDPLAIAPTHSPEGAPVTRKRRLTLHYLVQGKEGALLLPTTSPAAAALAVLSLMIAVGLRNMAVAGAPWAIEPREAYLPVAQTPPGHVAPTRKGSASHKGPPPPRRTVGRGRR